MFRISVRSIQCTRKTVGGPAVGLVSLMRALGRLALDDAKRSATNPLTRANAHDVEPDLGHPHYLDARSVAYL